MEFKLDPLEDAISKALVMMAELLANPKPVTAQLVEGWVLVLQEYGVRAEQVPSAVGRLLQTQTFFPTPADFIKAVDPPENREAAEELAWQRTLTCLRRFGGSASLCSADFAGDATALWVVERIGFERMARELSEENRAIWRAEFVRLFRAGRTTNARTEYLPGSYERENLARGYAATPRTVGRPDWPALPAVRELGAAPPQLTEASAYNGCEIVSLEHVLLNGAAR